MEILKLELLLIGIATYTGAQLPAVFDTQDADLQNSLNITNWVRFDCRRPSTNPVCSGAGTCENNGACSCDVGRAGYDCRYVSNDVEVTCGGIACNSVYGKCIQLPGPVVVCSCLPGFVGDDCGTVRASVHCEKDAMQVRMYPQDHQGFRGSFAAQLTTSISLSSHTSCSGNYQENLKYVPDPEFPAEMFFINSFRRTADSNPCDAYYTETDIPGGNGAKKQCYDVRLLYDDIITQTDELFTFCCSDESDAQVGETVSDNVGGGGAEVGGSISIINSKLIDTDSGDDVGNIVQFQQKLSFVMEIDAGGADRYQDFRVVDCVASPGSKVIVANSCPVESMRSIITGIRRISDQVLVDIVAYKPINSNQISLSCNCQVCNVSCGANQCYPPLPPTTHPPPPPQQDQPNSSIFSQKKTQCVGFPPTQLNEGRKKRQADTTEKGQDDEMVTTTVKVLVFNAEEYRLLNPPTPAVKESEPCYQSAVFISIATVFGLLLVVALVVSVVVCMRFAAARGRRNKPEPAAYFNSGMRKA